MCWGECVWGEGGGGDGGAVSFLGNYRPFLATISSHFAWLFYTIASVICDSETVRF